MHFPGYYFRYISLSVLLFLEGCHRGSDTPDLDILDPQYPVSKKSPSPRRLWALETSTFYNGEKVSREDFFGWIAGEREICPIVKRFGCGKGERQQLKKCRLNPCPSGRQARSLQEAPLDGTCRLPVIIPGTAVGSSFGTLFPNSIEAGFKLGKIKRRLTSSPIQNEYELSLRWRATINKHLPEYLFETGEQHSSLVFAFSHFLGHEIVLASESVNTADCARCCGDNESCSSIPILSEGLVDDLKADCFIRPPIQACAQQNPFNGEEVQNPFNQITGWIDGSAIYGTNNAALKQLGYEDSAYLREDFDDESNPFLPFSAKIPLCAQSGFCRCALAGDPRASAHAGLSTMHTTFVRFHNFMVDIMSSVEFSAAEAVQNDRVGPGGTNSERQPFSRVREFVILSLQKIVYEEWLPTVIGPSLCQLIGSGGLDLRARMGLVKDFHAGMFRLHQLVPEMDWIVNNRYELIAESSPMQVVFNPLFALMHGSRAVARGLMARPHVLRKSFFTHSTERLTASFNSSGLDIVAINVMRGREEGLLAYGYYFRDARRILSLAGLNGPRHPKLFLPPLQGQCGDDESLACKPPVNAEPWAGADDLDAFLGAVSELPVEKGALVGGTQASVIVQVFNSIAVNDPFFYRTVAPTYLFREALSKMNAQLLMCMLLVTGGDGNEVVAKNPFFLVDKVTNPWCGCHELLRSFEESAVLANIRNPIVAV